jgi:hypothetical protein
MSGNGTKPSEQERGGLRYYTRTFKRHPAFRRLKRPLDAAKHAVPFAWRRATRGMRVLPTAVIVGAQKAGTTQLFAHLLTHPRVMPGVKKEIDYFSRNADKSVDWYRSQFPLRSTVSKQQAHVIDGSPSYMAIPQALRQMQAVLPDARAIVILRDPVSRAFSHYQHRKTRHLELRSFDQAVEDELRDTTLRPVHGAALAPAAPRMWEYVARGYYALQLELLFNLYPSDRVLVIDSAELFADTSGTCNRVFDFLGIEHCHVHVDKVYNKGYYREQIDPRVMERLQAHYGPYNALLQSMIGRQFSWMMKAAAA